MISQLPHPLIVKGLIIVLSITFTATLTSGLAQTPADSLHRDTFNQRRFLTIGSIGAVIYGATVVGLNHAWYRDFEKRSFHFFNDAGEWKNVDKAGHAFTAYFESELSYHGLRWAGLPEKPATWGGAGLGMLFQTTVELLDAHSARWGFSWPDMAYNVLGVTLFTSQQLLWKEQRMRLKISSWPRRYSAQGLPSTDGQQMSSLKNRARSLFGKDLLENYLKDYNAQTIWLSVNPSSFWPSAQLPKWLNIGMGYGADNLYGGFANRWKEGMSIYQLDDKQYPRLQQWYLSLDVDFSRIPTHNKWIKTALTILNVFKAPAPAIELNSQGSLRWHWLHL